MGHDLMDECVDEIHVSMCFFMHRCVHVCGCVRVYIYAFVCVCVLCVCVCERERERESVYVRKRESVCT